MREPGRGLAVARHADGRAHLGGHGLRNILHARAVALDDPAQQRDALRLGLCRVNLGKAALAAATARSTSAAEPIEILVKASSVAGLMTSSVRGVAGSTQAPLI